MSIDDLEFITMLTRNPCPSWCELEPGHAYTEECEHGNIEVTTLLSRCHQIELGTATGSAFRGRRVPRSRHEAKISVLMEELAEPDETGVRTGKPTVFVDDRVYEMTLGEAEAFAEKLARAVVIVRAIEAGSFL